MEKFRKQLIRHKNKTLIPYKDLSVKVGISHVTLINFMQGDEIKQQKIKEKVEKFCKKLARKK